MNENVKQLVANAKTAISILERNKETSAIATISNMIRQANRNDVVVMVCGEFKKGKSSFINSLLEVEICAVDEDIATASISIIKYGETQKVVRYYDNNGKLESQDISIEEIDKYTKGDSTEVHSTVRLEISLNNEQLKNGLVIIDSPGVGGMNPLHKQLTKSFIPQADIVLFMLGADTPMSESEIVFYNDEILGKAKKTAFIMNKIDDNPNYIDLNSTCKCN